MTPRSMDVDVCIWVKRVEVEADVDGGCGRNDQDTKGCRSQVRGQRPKIRSMETRPVETKPKTKTQGMGMDGRGCQLELSVALQQQPSLESVLSLLSDSQVSHLFKPWALARSL